MNPLDRLLSLPNSSRSGAAAITAAFVFGRVSQALTGHPLLPAIRYRAQLEAARRCAGVDGMLIDPWHLAAVLAGLRLRLEGDSIADRGGTFDAARRALEVYGWLADPDCDQEGEIRRAEAAIAAVKAGTPFHDAAFALRTWVEAGESRMAMRAATIRHWHKHGLLPQGVPLVGAASLAADESWEPERWVPRFFRALSSEADELLLLVSRLDHAWRQAREAVRGRRLTSRAPALIDLLAAAPLLSSPAVAEALDVAPKNAIRLLDEMTGQGVIIEVSRRAKRRLYALPGMAPLRANVVEPKRPEMGRGRGRPPMVRFDLEAPQVAEVSSAPSTPLPRIEIDYSGLDAAMMEMEAATKRTRATLDAMFGKAGR